MIVLLADNHLAYRGTLTDMCKFLDVASRDSRTNAKIKTAIENLEKSGKIKTIKDGNTWTLTLAKKAERDKQIIRIRKDWITALRECDKCGVDWSASLKVWLYFIEHGNEITTNEKMREELMLSESTIVKAKKVLSGELWAIMTDKIVEKQGDGQYICEGKTFGTIVERTDDRYRAYLRAGDEKRAIRRKKTGLSCHYRGCKRIVA